MLGSNWKRNLAIILAAFAAAIAAALAVVIAIMTHVSHWAEREVPAAFVQRFHEAPKLSFDPQIHRGVMFGRYRIPAQAPHRFVFVSHYSSGENREGLLIAADSDFQATADQLCVRAPRHNLSRPYRAPTPHAR